MIDAKNQDNFFISIFLYTDFFIENKRQFRTRGPCPKLSDSEMITILIFCEILGYNNDNQIYRYIDKHYRSWFPNLPCYKTFNKQSNNLYFLKHFLFQKMFKKSDVNAFDGMPIPTHKLSRKHRDNSTEEFGKVSYCASKKEFFYGYKLFGLMNENKEICQFSLNSANIDERVMLRGFFEKKSRNNIIIIADKGLIGKDLQKDLLKQNVRLITPLRKNMKRIDNVVPENPVTLSHLMKFRRKIETIFSILSERFGINRIKSQNIIAFSSKVQRKIMAYNIYNKFKNQIDFA